MATRPAGRVGPPRAFLLAALGTSQARHELVEPRVPPAEARERSGHRVPLVLACRAFEHQGVLAEFVTQSLDVKVGRRHEADCCGSSGRPSIQ